MRENNRFTNHPLSGALALGTLHNLNRKRDLIHDGFLLNSSLHEWAFWNCCFLYPL